MRVQAIDHAAMLPLYLAAAAAVTALFAGRFAKGACAIGLAAAAAAAVWVGLGPDRATFAVGEWHSYVADDAAMGAAALFAALAVLVAALSGRRGEEYWFLLAASAAGGVALAGARDLITLIVALETLTLPLYVLVTRPGRDGAEAGAVFLIASVTSSATALMGAALLYAASGTVHLGGLAAGLGGAHAGLTAAGAALLLAGLAFKLAAAPLHAWAPLVLERAPLPVATYLASASKLGGAVAVTWVVHFGLSGTASAGVVVAVLSTASIAVGNLGALVQRRTVSLLAWSGIAHAGYALAPLAVIATAAGRDQAGPAASAAFAYAVFFVLLEAGAFAALTAVRPDTEGGLAAATGRPLRPATANGTASGTADFPSDTGLPSGTGDLLASGERRTPGAGLQPGGPPESGLQASAGNAAPLDPPRRTPLAALQSGGPRESVLQADAVNVGPGGRIAELAGLWKAAPLPAAVLLFAVIGLAGLPPALAGTFAKVAVLEVLASSAVWLAVVVAAGAVVGLAYYLPLARVLLVGRAGRAPRRFAVAVALAGLALAAVSLAPQVVLDFTALSR
ncbi:proton-conducting transporter transmembrane domain-containing protein [Glycomyces terrestris]|uniref:NADH-quinone oxidoreductase subunit N n=1 Tax=Glycomyces terrestris TaxID=2493553 RepID=A0A426UUY3_9ACTN|nr:proton-conducting transporter membrane subunit [Glycomyces terrestris]RRR97676.1 NADH-quinone oxidoreductase subunit N [Glycomyces terrestris]